MLQCTTSMAFLRVIGVPFLSPYAHFVQEDEKPRSATAVFNVGTPPAVADVACDSVGRERRRLGIRKGVVVYVGEKEKSDNN
ncbi:hypothetical protein L2E82_47475 [Cichorium intybus]|uniref:Uncharacterized protein n=1 Tax=Cichorium intybus TaxID=13427 RepID=A0ACB8YZR4_CICIN|nr:hypothetical protein L2E82_47475 [Cichorium intybus]